MLLIQKFRNEQLNTLFWGRAKREEEKYENFKLAAKTINLYVWKPTEKKHKTLSAKRREKSLFITHIIKHFCVFLLNVINNFKYFV